MTANATGATYQWLDCLNGFTVITDSTNQSFIPSLNGEYAVVVSQNGCVDTSSCISINTIGIHSLRSNNDINIYPNPTTNNVYIDFGKAEKEASIKVYSTTGKLMYYKTAIQSSLYTLELPQTAGVYILEIHTQEGLGYYKVIKE